MAPCPDTQEDERAAERLNRRRGLAEHDGRDDDGEEWHQQLEAGDTRDANDWHCGEVQDVSQAARAERRED